VGDLDGKSRGDNGGRNYVEDCTMIRNIAADSERQQEENIRKRRSR